MMMCPVVCMLRSHVGRLAPPLVVLKWFCLSLSFQCDWQCLVDLGYYVLTRYLVEVLTAYTQPIECSPDVGIRYFLDAGFGKCPLAEFIAFGVITFECGLQHLAQNVPVNFRR